MLLYCQNGLFLQGVSRATTTTVFFLCVFSASVCSSCALRVCAPGPRDGRSYGQGRVVRVMAPLGEIPELQALVRAGATSPLLGLCEAWLREDRGLSGGERLGGGSGR